MFEQLHLFYDVSKRYEKLNEKDRLPILDKLIPWENFRNLLNQTLEKEKKSEGGRKPYDYVMMFKILVLQSLYGLSDDQMEFQIQDRLSFMRFLNLKAVDDIPDAKTIWLYRETLTKAGAVTELFNQFNKYLEKKGYKATEGIIVDATIVEVPKQRMNSEQQEQVKKGILPRTWNKNKAMLRRKDTDARWTKKNGKSFYGYKNHISVDKKRKFICSYTVTNAAIHESKVFDELIDKRKVPCRIWGDSAYDTKSIAETLEKFKVKNSIQKQARGTQILSKKQSRLNRLFGKVRKRIEHVFGYQTNSMARKFIRSIGIQRAQSVIGLKNLAYNFSRYAYYAKSTA